MEGRHKLQALNIEGPGGTASCCLQHVYWQELSNLINLSQDCKSCHSTYAELMNSVCWKYDISHANEGVSIR